MGFTIGKLAKKAEINIETIRYYERTGLIEQPSKPPGGFRHYDNAVFERILFIKKAQTLGFSLDEIKTLLELSVGHCAEIQSLAEARLGDVRDKIRNLTQLETVLADLVEQCRAQADKSGCPIIESLQPGDID